jgi:uncharacterized coiled-coil protein SlyX
MSTGDKCDNEHRFVKLETRVDSNTTDIEELKLDATRDRDELRDILLTLTQLTTTLNTLKWIIVLFVSIFGGINVFLFQEVVKLI